MTFTPSTFANFVAASTAAPERLFFCETYAAVRKATYSQLTL